jgi:hypothetical protein
MSVLFHTVGNGSQSGCVTNHQIPTWNACSVERRRIQGPFQISNGSKGKCSKQWKRSSEQLCGNGRRQASAIERTLERIVLRIDKGALILADVLRIQRLRGCGYKIDDLVFAMIEPTACASAYGLCDQWQAPGQQQEEARAA